MSKLKVNIELDLDNEAMQWEEEIVRVMQEAVDVGYPWGEGRRDIKDLNGNTVGYIEFKFLEDG